MKIKVTSAEYHASPRAITWTGIATDDGGNERDIGGHRLTVDTSDMDPFWAKDDPLKDLRALLAAAQTADDIHAVLAAHVAQCERELSAPPAPLPAVVSPDVSGTIV